MSRGLLGLVAALLLGTAVPPRGAAAVTLPTPVESRLENGLRVVVLPVHRLPIVQAQLVVPAGAAEQGESEAGLASLTATALRQGTPSRDAVTFAREAEALGATLTATATRDYAQVSGSFLARDLDAGLELMADLVLRPAFPPEGVDRLKREALGNVLRNASDPVALADEQLWGLTLPGHPYGAPSTGTVESITSTNAEQVRSFYRDHYRPDRAVLVIAGDVTPERAFEAAREWFTPWSGRSVAARVTPVAPGAGVTIGIVDRPDLSRAEVRVGLVGPAFGASDHLAMAVGNWVLGGHAGSRLARASRSGALTEARSTLTPLRDTGMLVLAARANPDSAAAAVRRLMSELQRFGSQPPGDAELVATRRYFQNVLELPLETLGGIATQWQVADTYRLPAEFFGRYAEHLAAIGPAEVTAAVRHWAGTGRYAVVVVGPAARLRPLLEPLGKVEVLSPAGLISEQPPTPEQERQGRALVAAAIVAHGGADKLAAIRRSSVTSNVVVGLGGAALDGTMTQIRVEPYRMVLSTVVQGMPSVQVLDGNSGWMQSGEDSTAAENADSLMLRGMRSAFDSDLPHLLLVASRPETQVAFRGRERLANATADRVDIVTPKSPRRRLLLDATTHRLLAMDEPGRSGVGFGARRTYGDYRDVAGISWPHREDRSVDGERVMTIEVREVLLNPVVAEAAFRRPATLGGSQ